LALQESDLVIGLVSANSQDWLGVTPQALLGQPLATWVPASDIAAIHQTLNTLDTTFQGNAHLSLSFITNPRARSFACGIHQVRNPGGDGCEAGWIILELEPKEPEAPELGSGFGRFYNSLKALIAQLASPLGLEDLLQTVAREVRQVTGFDRVLVYQFAPEGHGQVVAEAKGETLAPFLGLHFPASDVPEPVRELYRYSPIRYVASLAPPVPLVTPPDSTSDLSPLDLSQAILRSVHPCCVEYYQNIGIAAALIIRVVVNQKLWGLIACHHYQPKTVPAQIRATCELIGQVLGLELPGKINQVESDSVIYLKTLQSQFIQSLAQAETIKQALTPTDLSLLDLVNAQGAAICLEDEWILLGKTPTLVEIEALITWANSQGKDGLFVSHQLPLIYSPAQAFKATGSGLLLLRISQLQPYFVAWFRPEVVQTVNWAGDPQWVSHAKINQTALSPESSFAQWQQVVQSTSLPWQPSEIENARSLRMAIVGFILNQADQLSQANQELKRSNEELAAFAYAASHDLKEPLRGIYNYSVFLLEDYAELLDEAGVDRLKTLLNLSERMEALIDVLLKFSQLGQTVLQIQTTDLNPRLERLIHLFKVNRPDESFQVMIPRPLPPVACDPVLVDELWSNLISNGLKYNTSPTKIVEVGYLTPAEQAVQGGIKGNGKGDKTQQQDLLREDQPGQKGPGEPPGIVFYVEDNGIGIRERHLDTIFRLFKRLHGRQKYGGGTGAGLTIAKKIIERHQGQIWATSTYGQGTRFYFSLGTGETAGGAAPNTGSGSNPVI
jgi:light-regulated signal transduction histidine kinase (bacteriophytochrome)